MRTTDPEIWKCPRCGLPVRICGGNCQRSRRRWRTGVLTAGMALALLATPLQAQTIVGPGPCHSDTPWGCYWHRVLLPMISTADIIVGDDAIIEP